MEGEPGEGFHYVKSGKVKIVKVSQDGREHMINILGPGEVFAEVLLFNHGPYPATAVTLADSVIGIIKNTDLENVVAGNARIALHIIRVMSKKLLQAQMKIKHWRCRIPFRALHKSLSGCHSNMGGLLPAVLRLILR
ncbi:Crp/Fnr family transcriptional regulator [Sporomusa termitida]|nr:cyclic nucleotide-binding domain-containing protein [Sporomusa termitida]